MGLDPRAFEYVRELLYERSAIVLEDGKQYLVESRLSPLARREGLSSVLELVDRMQAHPFGRLHAQAVEAMTTTETTFFRDFHPFETLRRLVLPELARGRSAADPIRIWSAACSSGQEAYSIAMLLRESGSAIAGITAPLLASDLSEEMLQRAQIGRYTQLEVNRGLPAPYLVKYFEKHAAEWQVRDEIRASMRFQRINLVETWPPIPRLDVVFMRNVLLYFDTATKKKVLERTRRLLRPEGYLFLGGAETTTNLDDGFRRVELGKTACFQLC